MELKYNTRTCNFGIKVSAGQSVKWDVIPDIFGGEIGAEAYFEVDLDNGPVAGAEAKVAYVIAGKETNLVEAKLPTWSFENRPKPKTVGWGRDPARGKRVIITVENADQEK